MLTRARLAAIKHELANLALMLISFATLTTDYASTFHLSSHNLAIVAFAIAILKTIFRYLDTKADKANDPTNPYTGWKPLS